MKKKFIARSAKIKEKLGDYSIYFYSDFVKKIKQLKKDITESHGVVAKPLSNK